MTARVRTYFVSKFITLIILYIDSEFIVLKIISDQWKFKPVQNKKHKVKQCDMPMSFQDLELFITNMNVGKFLHYISGGAREGKLSEGPEGASTHFGNRLKTRF